MRWTQYVLQAGGALLIAVGLGLWQGETQQASAQQLPPRPTVVPTAAPPATPEASGSSQPSTAGGRITGTVIDTTTGAPAPGVVVAMNDTLLLTDASGNYDRSGLPAGDYQVALTLRPDQGVPEQGMVQIALTDGATVVQHLRYRSPAPAAPEPVPAAHVDMPAMLPATSGSDSAWIGLVGGAALFGLGAAIRRRK